VSNKKIGFTIVEENGINALKLFRQYMALRPRYTKKRRFFLTYGKGRCTVQPVGKNTIGGVPNIIAKYLKLENLHQFTGHCLRRTSSTLWIEAGASFETRKMHGKWKSNTVAQSYVEEADVDEFLSAASLHHRWSVVGCYL
jgi:integrase